MSNDATLHHKIVTPEEWLRPGSAARRRERAHAPQRRVGAAPASAALGARRKHYRFETDDGPATLADLFRGNSQLLVYHFMFGPDFTAGCPSCSSIADGFNGICHPPRASRRLAVRRVARADRKAAGIQTAHGLDVSVGIVVWQRLQFDFQAGCTEEQQQSGTIEYNFRAEERG